MTRTRTRSTAGRCRPGTCSASSILPRSCGPSRSRRLTGRLVRLPEAERVPLDIAAAGEPAVALHGLLVLGLAAQLAHLRDRRVDVLGVEVDAQGPLLVRSDDRPALVLGGLEHPVVHLGRHRRPDLPAEDAAPESLRAVGVRRVDLHVDEFACHPLLLSTGLSSPRNLLKGVYVPGLSPLRHRA